MVSDNGKEFKNELLREILLLTGVQLHFTTPEHPQSNGIAERRNPVILNILRAIGRPDQSDWDLNLRVAQFAYNDSVSRGTRFTPNFLIFGRNLLTPLGISIGAIPQHKDIHQFYNDLVKSQELAAANEHKMRLEPKIKHDQGLKRLDYKVGDRVLLEFGRYAPHKSPKLAPRYQGPYEIIAINNSSLRLQNVLDKKEFKDRDVSKVRPYLAPVGGGGIGDLEYEVEQIVDEEDMAGTTYYRVRFLHYPPSHDRWLTAEDLVNAPLILKEWKDIQENKPSKPISRKDKVIAKSILSQKKENGKFVFKVSLDDEFGPDDHIEVFGDQIRNKDLINSYLKEVEMKDKQNSIPLSTSIDQSSPVKQIIVKKRLVKIPSSATGGHQGIQR